jgi:hypothetical protein
VLSNVVIASLFSFAVASGLGACEPVGGGLQQ